MGWGGDQREGRPGAEALRAERSTQVSIQEAQPGFSGETAFEEKNNPTWKIRPSDCPGPGASAGGRRRPDLTLPSSPPRLFIS